MCDMDVIHLKANFYAHVLDKNTTSVVLKEGPATFTTRGHEVVCVMPTPHVVVPPRHYCIVDNPVACDGSGGVLYDEAGQALTRHGTQEIRLHTSSPFALHPGESLNAKTPAPLPLTTLAPHTALRVRALRTFVEQVGETEVPIQREAGEEWLVEGPCTFYPHVCKEVVRTVEALCIGENQAVTLTALNRFTDRTGKVRRAGAKWLWTEQGPFLPSVDESAGTVFSAKVLTPLKALHVRAAHVFTDCFGRERRPGDQWLVTHEDTTAYLPTPDETVVCEVPLQVLNKAQYCVLLDPFDADKGQVMFGVKKLVCGPARFFLHPNERLQDGCAKDVKVLMGDEALLLEAVVEHTEEDGTKREAGDMWMLQGPCEYVPPVTVVVVEERRALPMHDFEGVYIRDLKSGEVRAQMGPCAYLLKPTEELWEKALPETVERLLLAGEASGAGGGGGAAARDKTRVVVYSVPHNSVSQIFDYKRKTTRCVYGPDMLALGPDEEFTVVSLSGGRPKRPGVVQALAVFLGPDFMTDNIHVETADHARLELQLSYSWRFDVDPAVAEERRRVFTVHDFVGDSCKAIASRIRGACAGQSFDTFHRNSSAIIRHAVFGSHTTFLTQGRALSTGDTITTAEGNTDTVKTITTGKTPTLTTVSGVVHTDPAGLLAEGGKQVTLGLHPNAELRFPTNGLVISNVDVQSVEPVDQKTKDSLLKSVQLAIHITTQGQEAQAKHKATKEEQKARGDLDAQLIVDKAQCEKERKVLLRLRAESQSIEATGSQRAEATAMAEAAAVEAQCMVELAAKRADAQRIQVRTEIALEAAKNQEAVEHTRRINSLEVQKATDLAGIESAQFTSAVSSMGKETIEAIAKAGPENQVRLLKALNLQGYMVTDGSSPINLFNAAQGMTGSIPGQ